MSEISREDLKQHCLRMVENAKKMAEHFGFELENHTGYQEHNMVLELIEKAEKLEKIEQFIEDNKCDHGCDKCEEQLYSLCDIPKIEQIVNGDRE